MNLPSGTVTFLFTDIEGSTHLWEEQPDTMRLALARHDALLRTAIETNGGTVFKTIGDAFCAAFNTAPKALEAALSAQQSLLRLKTGVGSKLMLKVRMALHTGTAEQREGDYFGQPLNRVARLLAAGHGGQVLLSQTTYDLTRDILPTESGLQNLGEHRLKDLARPETVFQLCHPELPSEFPPLHSLNNPTLPNNLPLQVTSFIGRDKEITAVKTLLTKTRLLTLTGSGGCGKTRLSLQVAADVLEDYPEGVWFIELASLTDPSLVPQTVAGVMGVREVPGESMTKSLLNVLKTKQMLLVLDNCEHLLEASARLVDALLHSCPKVRVLVSSREALGIAGESAYRVPSLSIPDLKNIQTPESLPQFEAVRLFIERAVAVRADFTVTNQNAPALASVCHRLDGIPLAIELAASRVRSMTMKELERRLDDQFRILTGGSRTALPRQQTLRGMIDWSYNLLEENQKVLFTRLSVFAGGWTLEAAEQVCAGEGLEDGEVLDLLTNLVDKSLVLYDEPEGKARYRLLETVHQYAGDRLEESGEQQTVKNKHQNYFLALVQRDVDSRLSRIADEYDNVRTALACWLNSPSLSETHFPVFWDMHSFWILHGYWSEGRDWLERGLRRVQSAPAWVQIDVWTALGAVACYQNDYEKAIEAGEQAVALSREMGDHLNLSIVLGYLGSTYWQQPSYERATAVLEESLTIAREVDNKERVAWALTYLGGIACEQGRYADALTLCEESASLFEPSHHWGMGLTLEILGKVAIAQANYEHAKRLLAQSIRHRITLGHMKGILLCLEDFAALANAQKLYERSGRLYGAAEALCRIHGISMEPIVREEVAQGLASTRQTLGDEAFNTALAEGQAMTLEQAIECTLSEPEVMS